MQLRDGRAFALLVPAPKGSPANPFTAEEHDARFVQELSTAIPEKACAEILAIAQDLDRLDPRRLGALLSGT